MFEIAVITIIGLCCLSIVWFTLRIGISPMPSSAKVCRAILKVSEQAPEGTIIDLGSGWGGLLFALARKYPDRQIIGYELSWLPWIYARTCRIIFRLHNVQLYRQSFLAVDLCGASLLVCYLFPKGMNDLQKKLADGPCPMLISSTFALPGCEPAETVWLDDLYKTPIYLYQFI